MTGSGLVIVVVVGVTYNVMLRVRTMREFVSIHVHQKLNTLMQEKIDNLYVEVQKNNPLLCVDIQLIIYNR